MSAPICGARTWTSSGELVTCDLAPNHHEPQHSGPVGNDRKLWTVPMCAILLGGCDHVWTPEEARSVRDRIQAQLDALDPDAAIAEAERRMVEAWERARALSGMAGSVLSNVEETLALEHARDCALETWDVRKAAWLELVEARDAKGGGA